jgi:hypothetical protein
VGGVGDYEELRGLHLRDLLAEDPERGKRLVAEGRSLDPPGRLSARTLAPGKAITPHVPAGIARSDIRCGQGLRSRRSPTHAPVAADCRAQARRSGQQAQLCALAPVAGRPRRAAHRCDRCAVQDSLHSVWPWRTRTIILRTRVSPAWSARRRRPFLRLALVLRRRARRSSAGVAWEAKVLELVLSQQCRPQHSRLIAVPRQADPCVSAETGHDVAERRPPSWLEDLDVIGRRFPRPSPRHPDRSECGARVCRPRAVHGCSGRNGGRLATFQGGLGSGDDD